MRNSLNDIRDKILELASEKGWGTRPQEINTYEKLALIHSEVSEAVEAFRRNNLDGKDGLKEELVDILLRTLHLAGIYGIDLDKEILSKIEANYSRDWSDKNETLIK